VAGFSQGAALSLNLFLTSPEKYKAAGAFGGRVMDEIKPQIVGADALLAKPVFLGFGNQDPFISPVQATQTQDFLQGLGMDVRTSSDDVGHSISGKQWGDFVGFLTGSTQEGQT
jgi:predicted esterase